MNFINSGYPINNFTSTRHDFINFYNRQKIGTEEPFMFLGRINKNTHNETRRWNSSHFRFAEEFILERYNIITAVDVVNRKSWSAAKLIEIVHAGDFYNPVSLDILDGWIDECIPLDLDENFLIVRSTWDQNDPKRHYLCSIEKHSIESGPIYEIRISRYTVEPLPDTSVRQ